MENTYIKRKDVKDTITVITLPYSMEEWMIERITDYAMLLLSGQRQELNEWVKSKMIDYCYDFAWHYGRLYHIGDAEKIKAAISEKFKLPEEFLSELLNSDQKVKQSTQNEAGYSGYTKEQIVTMFTSFTQENRNDYANQIYEIAKYHFKCDHKGSTVKIENSNVERCDRCGELLSIEQNVQESDTTEAK